MKLRDQSPERVPGGETEMASSEGPASAPQYPLYSSVFYELLKCVFILCVFSNWVCFKLLVFYLYDKSTQINGQFLRGWTAGSLRIQSLHGLLP